MNLSNREDLEKMDVEDLDELVHEAKGAEAAEINNGGKDAQIDFLLGGSKSKSKRKFKVVVSYELVREYDIEVTAEDVKRCLSDGVEVTEELTQRYGEDIAREKALDMKVEGDTIVPGDIQEENVCHCEEI